MQYGRKAVWSIPYISVAYFPTLKQNFIVYRSSEGSDCIFEIHQLWQSGFSRVYSNCRCSCLFEPEIIKIAQSSQWMYSNTIVNFQESTTILNAHTKKVWKPIVCSSYFFEILCNDAHERQSSWEHLQRDFFWFLPIESLTVSTFSVHLAVNFQPDLRFSCWGCLLTLWLEICVPNYTFGFTGCNC